MMKTRFSLVVTAALAILIALTPCVAQQGAAKQAGKDKAKVKPKAKARPAKPGAGALPGGTIQPTASLAKEKMQEDFPGMCVTPEGKVFVAYIRYDGVADTVRLAELTDKGLVERGDLSTAGNAYQPSLACDGSGRLWCVWSQQMDKQWELLGRTITKGRIDGEIVTVSKLPGNDLFPDVKADARGRVWAVWQNFNGGKSDVFAAHCESGAAAWSKPIQVTKNAAGDWEPRLAFGKADEALIVFDSSRGGNFDVLLARVSPAGKVRITPIAATDRYEARAEAAASEDGKTLWVAYEDGIARWGKDLGSEWRSQGGGLNYGRHLYLAKVDLATGKAVRLPDVALLVPGLLPIRGPNSSAINLPEVVVDEAGNPWLFFRIYGGGNWTVSVVKYDVKAGSWTQPRGLADSTYCQDRRIAAAVGADGAIYAVWPSDGRKGKQQGASAVYLAKLDAGEKLELAKPQAAGEPWAAPAPVNDTPERARDDHHDWAFGGQKYMLYWGDVHRHTDVSGCRTPDDGCIVEHFRYAYDAGGLDYLATSDHTEVAKVYHEYEWWQSQRYGDMFHNPPFFLGFYAYEREQKWPYGHRNVVFLERGGPIVYIKRATYAASRWATPLPPEDGDRKGELAPWQLWQLLRRAGLRTTVIAHTPACSMGTDWSVYKKIDNEVESVVEIYQGSRVSYEAAGAPQPAVAAKGGPQDFGKANAGTYQNALRLGLKLGAFASSDHRSTNISFGGVYVKEFTRKGVFDAIDARRTVAATDKIYMEFSCNGHVLGEIFESSSKPTMKVVVEGTAPLDAVTIVRNEANIRQFTPKNTARFEATFTDENPVAGENRYYVRVQQKDGNMGWTSPVWVTYKP